MLDEWLEILGPPHLSVQPARVSPRWDEEENKIWPELRCGWNTDAVSTNFMGNPQSSHLSIHYWFIIIMLMWNQEEMALIMKWHGVV